MTEARKLTYHLNHILLLLFIDLKKKFIKIKKEKNGVNNFLGKYYFDLFIRLDLLFKEVSYLCLKQKNKFEWLYIFQKSKAVLAGKNSYVNLL